MADSSEVDRAFAKAVASARSRKELTRAAVAREMTARGLDMHETTIGKIERSERRVTVGEASALSEILGLHLDLFLEAKPGLNRLLELEQIEFRYEQDLALAAEVASRLSTTRGELLRAIEHMDELGGGYRGATSAAEFYRDLLDLEREKPLFTEPERVWPLIERYKEDG